MPCLAVWASGQDDSARVPPHVLCLACRAWKCGCLERAEVWRISMGISGEIGSFAPSPKIWPEREGTRTKEPSPGQDLRDALGGFQEVRSESGARHIIALLGTPPNRSFPCYRTALSRIAKDLANWRPPCRLSTQEKESSINKEERGMPFTEKKHRIRNLDQQQLLLR
jgi:hypothetical protein